MARNAFFMLFVILTTMLSAGCAQNIQAQDQHQKIQPSEVGEMTQKNIEGVNIAWLGQSGFLLKNDKTIYIDPFNTSAEEKADIILITHAHYDHCSVQDVKRIIKPETIIVTVPDCQSKLSGLEVANITLVKPGDKLNIKGTTIETVPAYNINKKFHPKENEWVGFVVTINGTRIYHAGDTDFIPEMRNLTNIGIALMPIGGTYTMNAEEAAQAVNAFKPKVAIPMHYGSIVGARSDADKFRSLAQVDVEILA